ncbi:MAG: M48 family metallopeptidase, partial [Myxococcota bacterium]
EDLEQLSDEVWQKKKQRKVQRSRKNLWKNIAVWGVQFGYVVGGIPLFANMLLAKFSPGTTYTVLSVAGWLLNMGLSRMFSLWAPTLPFMPHAHNPRKVWTFGNALWQGFWVASWTAPTYFFYSAMSTNGWIGSVAMLWVSQIVQLAIFIFTIKKQAIPYQKYEGLSDNFKGNLHQYLKSQGFEDHEVGVLKGLKMGPNAFATGLTSGYRQIVMTEELVKGFQDPQNPDFELKLSDDALESVIAHEVGHIKNYHVQKSVLLGGIISSFTTILVYSVFGRKGLDSILFDDAATPQLLMFWGQSILNITLVFLINFVMIGMIRGNEYQADTHLLETNGCKKGHEFFHQIRHIAPVNNHPVWDRLNSTHPAPHLREKRIRDWQKEHCEPT